MIRWPPVELWIAAILIAAISCAGGTEKPKGYPGEVIAKKTKISARTGEMVVVITVGFQREPNLYEQDTREYPAMGPEGRFKVGDCVLVQPYGIDVKLVPC